MDAYSEVPDFLKNTPNWVTWKSQWRKGKTTKVPLMMNGAPASHTDPNTWTTFDAVKDVWPTGAKGIGFVFDGRGYVGIDLDDCIDEDGNINPKFTELLTELRSYAEISPSGTGVHLIIKCTETPFKRGRKKPELEIYSTLRFFTVTGDKLEGFPNKVVEYPAELVRKLVSPFLGEDSQETDEYLPYILPTNIHALTDDEIISIVSHAKNGNNFVRLMSGDISGYPSGSEADSALAAIVGWYTYDWQQVERIMRRSRLVREKWNIHTTYLARTINNAMKILTTHYEIDEDLYQARENCRDLLKNMGLI